MDNSYISSEHQIKRSAIVTGASSGIGLEISKQLCELGYDVYGIGREFHEEPNSNLFHPVILDLLDTEQFVTTIKTINQDNQVEILINNAGCAYYGLHEELSPLKISQMVRINLEVPMIACQLLLRTLKKNKGTIINISSVTATKSNPHGCAYGATKAGLTNFGNSLFDEARKYGVKVVTVQPDMTKTNLYRNADFCESNQEDERLLPEDISAAVAYILNQRPGILIKELTIQPQKHRIRRKTDI